MLLAFAVRAFWIRLGSLCMEGRAAFGDHDVLELALRAHDIAGVYCRVFQAGVEDGELYTQ